MWTAMKLVTKRGGGWVGVTFIVSDRESKLPLRKLWRHILGTGERGGVVYEWLS